MQQFINRIKIWRKRWGWNGPESTSSCPRLSAEVPIAPGSCRHARWTSFHSKSPKELDIILSYYGLKFTTCGIKQIFTLAFYHFQALWFNSGLSVDRNHQKISYQSMFILSILERHVDIDRLSRSTFFFRELHDEAVLLRKRICKTCTIANTPLRKRSKLFDIRQPSKISVSICKTYIIHGDQQNFHSQMYMTGI